MMIRRRYPNIVCMATHSCLLRPNRVQFVQFANLPSGVMYRTTPDMISTTEAKMSMKVVTPRHLNLFFCVFITGFSLLDLSSDLARFKPEIDPHLRHLRVTFSLCPQCRQRSPWAFFHICLQCPLSYRWLWLQSLSPSVWIALRQWKGLFQNRS